MGVSKEHIENRITWFNKEVDRFKKLLHDWLRESGHDVDISEEELVKVEELSGQYKTKKYNFRIDQELNISVKPFGIWIIGAEGRIDVFGPSGSEKFIFLSVEEAGITAEEESASGGVVEKSRRALFKNVDESNWYWFDDSSYRKVSKLSREIVEPLLERLQ